MRLTACQRGLRVLCHSVAGLTLVAGVWLWVVAGGGGTWVLDLREQGVGVFVRDGAVACVIGKFEPRDDTVRTAIACSDWPRPPDPATDRLQINSNEVRHVNVLSLKSLAAAETDSSKAHARLEQTRRQIGEIITSLALMGAIRALHSGGYGVFARRSCGDLHVVAVTRWCVVPVMLLAALPSLWLLRADARQRARARTGRCLACGYSLTGNQSGVCPECGAGTPGMPR